MRRQRMSSRKEKSIMPKLVLLGILAVIGVGGVFYFADQAEKKAPPLQEIRMEAENVEIR